MGAPRIAYSGTLYICVDDRAIRWLRHGRGCEIPAMWCELSKRLIDMCDCDCDGDAGEGTLCNPTGSSEYGKYCIVQEQEGRCRYEGAGDYRKIGETGAVT